MNCYQVLVEQHSPFLEELGSDVIDPQLELLGREVNFRQPDPVFDVKGVVQRLKLRVTEPREKKLNKKSLNS